MYKILTLLVSLNLWTCEKPSPQQPVVIYTKSYRDTVKVDSTGLNKSNSKNDSLLSQNIPLMGEILVDSNFKKYTNSANQLLLVSYLDNPKEVFIKFEEKNVNTKLSASDAASNIYANDSIKWETMGNKKLGKLTINGTWFEFIEAD